ADTGDAPEGLEADTGDAPEALEADTGDAPEALEAPWRGLANLANWQSAIPGICQGQQAEEESGGTTEKAHEAVQEGVTEKAHEAVQEGVTEKAHEAVQEGVTEKAHEAVQEGVTEKAHEAVQEGVTAIEEASKGAATANEEDVQASKNAAEEALAPAKAPIWRSTLEDGLSPEERAVLKEQMEIMDQLDTQWEEAPIWRSTLEDGLSPEERAVLNEQMEIMDQLDTQWEDFYSRMFSVCLPWVKEQADAKFRADCLRHVSFEEMLDMYCPLRSYDPFDENYVFANETEKFEFFQWQDRVVFRVLLERYTEEEWQAIELVFHEITGEKIQRPVFCDAQVQTLEMETDVRKVFMLSQSAGEVSEQEHLKPGEPTPVDAFQEHMVKERVLKARRMTLEAQMDDWEFDVTLADNRRDLGPLPPSPEDRSYQEIFEAMSDSRKHRVIESLKFLRSHLLVSRRSVAVQTEEPAAEAERSVRGSVALQVCWTVLASATLESCNLSLCSGPHYYLEPTQERTFPNIKEEAVPLQAPKAESFGHGKVWVLAIAGKAHKQKFAAMRRPPDSSFLLAADEDRIWFLLHKGRFTRLKWSDFKHAATVATVAHDSAVSVAAKLCQCAVTLEGTLRLVFDESMKELPEVKVLLDLSEDDFNMQAAELAIDSDKKNIAALIPKIRKLRAERAKRAVDLQKVGEDAAKVLEPFHNMSEKAFQQYIMAVQIKPSERRTDQEKAVLRAQGPLRRLRRDEKLKASCSVVNPVGSAKFKLQDFLPEKLEAWSYRRDTGIRQHTNAMRAIAKALEDNIAVVFHGGHGSGKTSLAMTLADLYAARRGQESWFCARSMEGLKEITSFITEGSIILLDEAKVSSSSKDHVKMLLSSDNGQMDARYKDVMLPPNTRRMFTIQSLQRLSSSFEFLDCGMPDSDDFQSKELGEDDLAILRRALIVRAQDTLFVPRAGDAEDDELDDEEAFERVFGCAA
ncbi:unnamed protein product, partial [Effrenium voratum]